MSQENNSQNVFGMIGLGTMGSNLLQNIADQGYHCAGYDISTEQVSRLNSLGRDNIRGFSDMKAFVDSLVSPKTVMMLVPAGNIVDKVIEQLLQYLQPGDIIIDGGNSHFTDTERRSVDLEEKGFHFFGMGVSGGEEGARRGPSMMPGGDREAYKTVQPVLEKIAAHVNGEPTVAYMGKRSAGHFVKMVHNGIEYAIMQLISETYAIMKNGLQMKDEAIHDVFRQWNEGRLQSYLLEITRDIFAYKEKGSDHLLLNDIKDQAKAKGTGKWTSQVAMDLGVAIPVIDVAVTMRNLSSFKDLRVQASKLYPNERTMNYTVTNDYLYSLEQALFFSMISAYAQGMHLLYMSDKEYQYGLNLSLTAKIWRGGCIIRSAFLEVMYTAYRNNPDLEHLYLDNQICDLLADTLPGIRTVVSDAAIHGIAVPALATSLGYFDNFRNAMMPSNLIQAQRDFFGAHTYELIGKDGVFHTDWEG